MCHGFPTRGRAYSHESISLSRANHGLETRGTKYRRTMRFGYNEAKAF